MFPDLHHLRTKDFIYKVPKVELCSKKPMRQVELYWVDETTDELQVNMPELQLVQIYKFFQIISVDYVDN